MAEVSRWVFGAELPTLLHSDMGWDLASAGSAAVYSSVTSPVRTWTGAPTRHALRWFGGSATARWPAYLAPPTNLGRTGVVVCTFTLAPNNAFGSAGLFFGVIVNGVASTYLQTAVGSTTADLYVAGVFQATTSSIAWGDYHQIAVAYDASANPHRGRVEIDGVVDIAEQTQAAAAATSLNFVFNISPHTAGSYVHECRAFSLFSDSPPVRFVSRGGPDADGTDVGVFTPSSGTDNFSRIDEPYNPATYTENVAASPGDYVEVTTPTFSAMLGMTPQNIDGVSLHVFASGATASMDARMSDDGAAFVDGDDLVLGGTTGHAGVSSNTRPSDAATWSGGDSLTIRTQVTA